MTDYSKITFPQWYTNPGPTPAPVCEELDELKCIRAFRAERGMKPDADLEADITHLETNCNPNTKDQDHE
jgi:hypothetical protein